MSKIQIPTSPDLESLPPPNTIEEALSEFCTKLGLSHESFQRISRRILKILKTELKVRERFQDLEFQKYSETNLLVSKIREVLEDELKPQPATPALKPIHRDHSAEKENVIQALNHLSQVGHDLTIVEWWQKRENDQALTENRMPKTLSIGLAKHKFLQALLEDNEETPESDEEAFSETPKDFFRKLWHPPNKKLTAVEACRLQFPRNRPTRLTPEQQTYVERYDEWVKEISRFEMPILESRLKEWDDLERQGRVEEVWADQAKLWEEWLEHHPEEAKVLIKCFSMPTSSPGQSKRPKSVHWSGLYWIAANVVFKRFGMGDQIREEVGQAVFDRLYQFSEYSTGGRPFSTLTETQREERDSAYGEAMVSLYKILVRQGAHTIQKLEHWLVHSAKMLLHGGRIVDPELRKRQRHGSTLINSDDGQRDLPAEENNIFDATQESFNESLEDPPVPSPLDPEKDFRELAESLIDFPEEEPRGEPFEYSNLLLAIQLKESIRSMPEKVRKIVFAKWRDPTLTQEDLARQFNCTDKTIRNYLKQARQYWEASQ